MPHHLTCRSRRGSLAFRTHTEARWLWDRILHHVPDPLAFCLMPDHVHLLHTRDVRRALGAALADFAQRRNHARGESGRVWQDQPPSESFPDGVKTRRSVRYIHLNPCRAGLVADPLGWAWSTHRDQVGLAVPPVCPPRHDPHRFHAYVSADPTVAVSGTMLPAGQQEASLEAVVAAVSAVTRTPVDRLQERGRDRSFLLASLRALTGMRPAVLARELGLHRSTLTRCSDLWTPAVRVVARVAGDPRFEALQTWDLRRRAAWHRYRSRT